MAYVPTGKDVKDNIHYDSNENIGNFDLIVIFGCTEPDKDTNGSYD